MYSLNRKAKDEKGSVVFFGQQTRCMRNGL
jgi:hypothetical protein